MNLERFQLRKPSIATTTACATLLFTLVLASLGGLEETAARLTVLATLIALDVEHAMLSTGEPLTAHAMKDITDLLANVTASMAL